MMNAPAPRISGKMLSQFMGRTIVIICDSNSAGQDQRGNPILRTTDGVEVVASIPPGERLETRFVQFTAKVLQPNYIEVASVQMAGDELNVAQYNSVLQLMTGQFSHLFLH